MAQGPRSDPSPAPLKPATVAKLRERLGSGGPVNLAELTHVYLEFAKGYYQKNGRTTREVQLIREIAVELVEGLPQGNTANFGPAALDEFREHLITEKDWTRGFINSQIARIVRMVKWGCGKEICPPTAHAALAALTGLRKGRTPAREGRGVQSVSDEAIKAKTPMFTKTTMPNVKQQRALNLLQTISR